MNNCLKLCPAVAGSGFKMEGYYVWCGSVIKENGKYLLYFRDGNLNVYVARAEKFSGPFEIINDHIFKNGIIEDMFTYIDEDGKYVMVAEDAGGKYTGVVKAGVRFESDDGVVWDGDSALPAYDFDVDYDDGTHLFLQRRERPFMLWDNGKKYLFTTAKIGGEDMLTGGDTWNMVQEIEEIQV